MTNLNIKTDKQLNSIIDNFGLEQAVLGCKGNIPKIFQKYSEEIENFLIKRSNPLEFLHSSEITFSNNFISKLLRHPKVTKNTQGLYIILRYCIRLDLRYECLEIQMDDIRKIVREENNPMNVLSFKEICEYCGYKYLNIEQWLWDEYEVNINWLPNSLISDVVDVFKNNFWVLNIENEWNEPQYPYHYVFLMNYKWVKQNAYSALCDSLYKHLQAFVELLDKGTVWKFYESEFGVNILNVRLEERLYRDECSPKIQRKYAPTQLYIDVEKCSRNGVDEDKCVLALSFELFEMQPTLKDWLSKINNYSIYPTR